MGMHRQPIHINCALNLKLKNASLNFAGWKHIAPLLDSTTKCSAYADRNGLWVGCAFEGFMHHEEGYARGDGNCIPDEPALGSLDGRSPHALRPRAPRTLGIGIWIEHHAVSFAFRNFTHIIFDGNLQRATDALHD